MFAASAFEEPATPYGRTRRVAATDACPYDQELFDRLRAVRRKLSEERGLPAYFILHDAALRQMAREYPADERELALIGGVGEKRAQGFGAVFLDAIAEYLSEHPRQIFAGD